MLLARATDIGARETSGELQERLARLGAQGVVDAIEDWTAGRIAPLAQPDQGVTYAAKIRKEEAAIDWTQPAVSIARQVRAFNPWPVAETRWRGRQLRIWQASLVTGPGGAAAPGAVIEADAGRILVATGTGALQLETLQLPGRKPTTAADFLRAFPLAGARLGSNSE
jgi:methionyl-tRNA formyltransferase